MPLKSFIRLHKKLSEKKYFVSGTRILLNEKFTFEVITNHLPIYNYTFLNWICVWLKRDCDRFLGLMKLPLGILRKFRPKSWHGVKGCNIAAWKDDFLLISGFDENYIGWGYEDSDLVIRLINNGIYRIDGHFAIPVIHLWHKIQDRTKSEYNYSILQEKINNKIAVCQNKSETEDF